MLLQCADGSYGNPKAFPTLGKTIPTRPNLSPWLSGLAAFIAAFALDPTVPAYARYGPQLTWVQIFASVKMKVQKTTDVSNRNDSQNITYLGCFDIWSGRTLQGSFSALSTPMFVTKYSVESSRRYLPCAVRCTALQYQSFIFKIAENLLLKVSRRTWC